MKSDISRPTFNPGKHYKSVRMQQGRVQIDADWNEESDINIHRIETEALDLIGECGGPIDAAAFGIIAGAGVVFDEATLDPHEQERLTRLGVLPLNRGDFLLTAGRYYVDGILCENELVVSFDTQPDYPTLKNDSHIPIVKGRANPVYLAYLDVWERSITAIDDSQIREVALGGPDTGTRLKTVWQAKLFPVSEDSNCVKAFLEFLSANPPSNGSLSAKTESEAISPDPCIVPPGAGFRGLENQLYRIEIHNGGAAFNVAGGAAGTAVSDIIGNNQVQTTGTWTVGQAVEIFSGDAPANLRNRTLAYITIVDQNTGTLTLNTKITNLTMQEHPQIRAVNATFKWSRDNGSVVTAIERIEGREITVAHTGLDTVLGFAPDQWVEIIDDALELNGRPGQLAQIAEVDSARRLITLKTDPTLLDSSPDGVNPAFHPKLRRWDGIGAVDVDESSAITGYINIEDGVQVRFGAGNRRTGNYRTGDYWTIPARTATTDAQSGRIEWPQDNNNPLALSPFGIRHHYCPLGLLSLSKGVGFTLIDDCRHLFPPVTELTSLFYVSGDGQEAMPDPKLPDALLPLKQSLVVGVANGSRPVKGALVLFEIEGIGGNVMRKGGTPESNGKAIGVLTDENGLAACDWHIDSITQSQQVSARLLDADGNPVHLPVIFTANLSVASEVAYDTGNCLALLGQNTVKKMLDTLSLVPSLYYLSGDGQEVMPGQKLQPLRVLVANRCGPVSGRTVRFIPVPDTGALTDITTDSNGVAEFRWSLNTSTHRQEMEAILIANSANPATTPTKVRFSATLSTADQVSYVPPAECLDLAEAKTVQAAIDALCKRKSGGGCAVTVGKGGQFESLAEAIRSLLGVPQEFKNIDVCICLLPGDHELAEGLEMDGTGNKVQIKIEGCGHGTRIIMRQRPVIALGLVSFTLREVEVFADQPEAFFRFEKCDDITVEGCYLTRENQANPFITIAHARRIHIEDNFVQTFLAPPKKAVTPDRVFADVDAEVSELFNIRNSTEFDRKSSQIATRLASVPPKGKAAFINRLRQSLEKIENLTPGESKVYGGFQQAFNAQPADEHLIRARLADIKVAALRGEPGIAIALMDAEADTWIESNNIEGVVSLYGLPGKERLTPAEMELLLGGMKRSSVIFSNSLANLQVLDNIIYRIDVSAQKITLLKALSTSTASGSIDGCYRRCFIKDNAISDGNNNFVMEHLALTSNSFDKRIISEDTLVDAGTVVANAAINVGNYAPDDVRLFVVAPAREKAANLGINIIEI